MMRKLLRGFVLTAFGLMLLYAGWQNPGPPSFASRLELSIEPRMPARVYLFKNNRPFKMQPVQAALPIKSDQFYRDRLWTDGNRDPDVLEVIVNDEYHYLLLKGFARFHLPPGQYRIEVYRGLFYRPAQQEFQLQSGETRQLSIPLRPWEGVRPEEWISGDDHIHLTRTQREDPIYLDWLKAEDLSVGNFLQLQRQMDAAVQYGFGRKGEFKQGGYTIRPGQETRNERLGHILMLGVERLIRPLSTGKDLANTPEDYPFHSPLFDQGIKAGGTTGYAHFRQRPVRSTLYMDLALGKLQFLEVFQFGVLTTEPWYELLNAGFRITGLAGSDFPGHFSRLRPYPRWIPLLGPERAIVKARPGADPYEIWAEGIRKGNVVLTNGPLVEIAVDEKTGTANATASFWRPLALLEIVRNGSVVASINGDGRQTRLSATVSLKCEESCWAAARVKVAKDETEPSLEAHTNAAYLVREGKPVMIRAARQSIADQWEAEITRYRAAGLVFTPEQNKEFFEQAERALTELRRPLRE
jgi:hypothetical protein